MVMAVPRFEVERDMALPMSLEPRMLVGHVLEQLRLVPAGSVDLVVSSPPYFWKRRYPIAATPWGGSDQCAHEWVDTSTKYWDNRHGSIVSEGEREGRGGTADNRGPVTSRLCRKCERFEGQHGQEPSVGLYIRNEGLVFRELDRVLAPHGVIVWNVQDSHGGSNHGPSGKTARRLVQEELQGFKNQPTPGRRKALLHIPARLQLLSEEVGWYEYQTCIWDKGSGLGESVRDRPTTNHEFIFVWGKGPNHFWDQLGELLPLAPVSIKEMDENYTGKARRDYGAEGAQDPSEVKRRAIKAMRERGGANMRSVMRFTRNKAVDHPAAFPVSLPTRFIKLATPEGGVCTVCGVPTVRQKDKTWGAGCGCGAPTRSAIVLDPFAGSGTTLLAAATLGRRSIGIEASEKHARMAELRIRDALAAEAKD